MGDRLLTKTTQGHPSIKFKTSNREKMWNYSSIISETKGDIREKQINSMASGKEGVGQGKCPKEADPLSQIWCDR